MEIGAATIAPQTLHLKRSKIDAYLTGLHALCAKCEVLVGHNIIEFDLQHLRALNPRMPLHHYPVLDTLWLNPLAFPKSPYHHLIKHYQNGQLQTGYVNNPVADAQEALDILQQQYVAIAQRAEQNPALVLVWHWLVATEGSVNGFTHFFNAVRQAPTPTVAQAQAALQQLLQGNACGTFALELLHLAGTPDRAMRWSLAYALAWLQVSGSNSVMPPWVRHQFPQAVETVRRLRNTPCANPACAWCTTHHDAVKELQRWFPHLQQYRPTPTDAQGLPLQQAIVEATMRSQHVLGILPTGTGKSVCYQVPALSRFFKTGALTIVISPLVALMADQVAGLRKQGITVCAALNGLLSMPERRDVLNQIRLGDLGILLLAPEQLRSRTVRVALEQREIGGWVLDEAHCLSKWGHDFRPDYRYVSRFIKERAMDGPLPPILCLTATAKPDVVADLKQHFQDKLGVELQVFNGGANRTNLDFQVIPSTNQEKLGHLLQILAADLPPKTAGGAIVYCATRKTTAQIADFLKKHKWDADFFHGGLRPPDKKTVQERFINGELRVIAATNAFGMGIDKPDVRLVVHFDMPGSLENYLQEAGRAGRDRAQAKCILLYAPEDAERQFGLNALSRLNTRDIQAVLKSIRRLDKKKRRMGEVVATSGEILHEDEEAMFNVSEDQATDDTRVKTAVAWLEEAGLLQRQENSVQVFPSSLKIKSLQEAQSKLQHGGKLHNEAALLTIVTILLNADPEKGITTDDLMGATGLTHVFIRKAMHDLEHLNICSNDMALSAFVNVGGVNASSKQLEMWCKLEQVILQLLRSAAPDMECKQSHDLNLRKLTQEIKDDSPDLIKIHPDIVLQCLQSLAEDGRRMLGAGTIKLQQRGEHLRLSLQTEWPDLHEKIKQRNGAANIILLHFLSLLGQNSRGSDLLAETTVGALEGALRNDIELSACVQDFDRLTEQALLWLHGVGVLTLNRGIAIFRSAMTLHLTPAKKGFTKTDFKPLEIHYQEQVEQIHVIAEYAERAKNNMAEALRLASDYFQMPKADFINSWLPNRARELQRQTSPESWQKIVEDLGNPVQRKIVADDREKTNVLVLAGPGSGKTRVLVHRIAYLVRVRREKPTSILALAYNRHAAEEIRLRLRALIGLDAVGVLIMTCHALAMRLVGVSFAGDGKRRNSIDFNRVLSDAVNLLKGEGLAPEEADEQRERLLAGFRWILVDEYQDIGESQYDLISALAGRTAKDSESQPSLFAVGDDDQNIYEFNGASLKYIKKFEADYKAKPVYLVDNYRSTNHIITTSNAVIAGSAERMKVDYAITINPARQKLPPGGDLQKLDPVAQGRVHVITVPNSAQASKQQALAVVDELQRLAAIVPGWQWDRVAVIARAWDFLAPVRAYCESIGIAVQMGDEDFGSVWRLRETQALVEHLRQMQADVVLLAELQAWLQDRPQSPWNSLLIEGLDTYRFETGTKSTPPGLLVDWIAEWGREFRRKQHGLMLITAHRAKGLEFDHVAILDGQWPSIANVLLQDAERRLFYVAMTRAKYSLTIAAMGTHPFTKALGVCASVFERGINALADLPSGVNQQYIFAQLNQVDLGFAGRLRAKSCEHVAIAQLEMDASLQLRYNGNKYTLHNADGVQVGSMAKSFGVPSNMQCIKACVYALHTRWKSDVQAPYNESIKMDVWEVVVPELVFAPIGR